MYKIAEAKTKKEKEKVFEEEVDYLMFRAKTLNWDLFFRYLLNQRNLYHETRNSCIKSFNDLEKANLPERVKEMAGGTNDLISGYYNAYRQIIEELKNDTFGAD